MAAVMALDLDGFKEVNDTYGHGAGDALLIEIASRLKASMRNFDTVIRLGGDEFLVLSPEMASREQAEKMADRLLDSVDGTSPEELIANSDRARYATKRKGKDRHSFFEKNEKA